MEYQIVGTRPEAGREMKQRPGDAARIAVFLPPLFRDGC